MIFVFMLFSGVTTALVRILVSIACRPLRLATGVLFWLLSLAPVPGRALRSPSELKDGREYEFRCRSSRTRRTYFSDPARAATDERETFALATDSRTGTPGIQCWQKRFPNGSPVGPSVGCWITLDLFFGKRARKNPWGIRLRVT